MQSPELVGWIYLPPGPWIWPPWGGGAPQIYRSSTLAELVATIPEEMGVAVPGSSSEDEAAETTSTSSTLDDDFLILLY